MAKIALVSTVDSMGPGFPSHCVFLFDDKRDAYEFAMNLICEHDESVGYSEDEKTWLVNDSYFDRAEDALIEWQDKLSATEFLHVMPVEESSSG